MRKRFLGVVLLFPLAASAGPRCEASAPRNLDLDLAGIGQVVFEVGPHDLTLTASANAVPAIKGTACASSNALLETVTLSQRRDGNTLTVTLDKTGNNGFSLLGRRYAYLDLAVTLPDTLPVRIRLGSGDVAVSGGPQLDLGVGSGDAEVRDVRGAVSARVGSGDLVLERIGSLHVGSIGSGDVTARRIAGDTKIDSIGSGDADLDEVGGNVDVGSLGSGDLDVRNVRGNLRVRSIGSGDVEHSAIHGSVELPDA